MNTALWILAVVLVLAGIAGTVLPALPGAILIFAGLFLGAWLDDFHKVGGTPLIALAILTLLSFLADLFASAWGVESVDASRPALIGAMLGSFVGIFTGITGLILGPFVGAAAGEFIARRDVMRAGHVGLMAWAGYALGSAVKLALAFVMVAIFITAYLWK